MACPAAWAGCRGSSSAGSATGGAATGGSGGTSGGTSAAGNGGGGGVDPSKLDKFSFFVTSMAAMRELAKSELGFGGDLTYGTGDGLLGADKICSGDRGVFDAGRERESSGTPS